MWTLQSSALFLLLVFVRNLAKPYVSFGSSWEFWAYQVWAVGSLVSYPAMTVLFEYCLTSLERHKLLAAVVPQMINHVETAFISLVLWRSDHALRRATATLSPETRRLLSARFLWPTRLLVLFLLMDVAGLSVINVDIVLLVFAGGSGAVYSSAFASDLCISVFSIGLTGSHAAVLYLLYPPPSITYSSGAQADAPGAGALYSDCSHEAFSTCRSTGKRLSGEGHDAEGASCVPSRPIGSRRVAPAADAALATSTTNTSTSASSSTQNHDEHGEGRDVSHVRRALQPLC